MTTASLLCDQLEVWLEIADPTLWPDNPGAWDVSHWDQPDGEWAMEGDVGYALVTKYVRGFTLERGRQGGSWDSTASGSVKMELDNTTGVFSVYGTTAYPRIRPGFGLKIDGVWEGVRYPLFRGMASEWREKPTPDDDNVTLEADDFSRVLNDPIAMDYIPGVDAQLSSDRIVGLLNRVPESQPRSIQPGVATMTNYATTRSILDEVHITAISDGGVFFVDNDGTLIFLNRQRLIGRPREGAPPIFGDACDSSELPYAAIEPRIADAEFGNVVTVSNVSQGNDSQQSAKSVDQASIDANGRFLWSPNQLPILNAAHVQGMSDWELARRSKYYYRIDSFECYPVHDDNLWPALLGMRIGDSLFVRRRPPNSTMISAAMICDGIRIEATPELWKQTTRCTPAVGDIASAEFWDYANWDVSEWV